MQMCVDGYFQFVNVCWVCRCVSLVYRLFLVCRSLRFVSRLYLVSRCVFSMYRFVCWVCRCVSSAYRCILECRCVYDVYMCALGVCVFKA